MADYRRDNHILKTSNFVVFALLNCYLSCSGKSSTTSPEHDKQCKHIQLELQRKLIQITRWTTIFGSICYSIFNGPNSSTPNKTSFIFFVRSSLLNSLPPCTWHFLTKYLYHAYLFLVSSWSPFTCCGHYHWYILSHLHSLSRSCSIYFFLASM